ncbi:hypothetical protein BDR06DRAFT_953129 [Suillus hirtellus]|nr:hypothetical protein BDR06DRAFT_953129 [Suillus hirtellus]
MKSKGKQNALKTSWWTVCKDTGDVAGTCCGAAVDDLNTGRHQEAGGHERWGAA